MDWKEEYCTGVEDIDVQHRYFFALVSAMDEEKMASWSRDRFRVLLAEIQRFAHYHFRSEERLMDAYGFADRAAHEAEHARIKRGIDEFLQQAEIGALDMLGLRKFLFEWLTTHTEARDRPLAEHVRKMRSEPPR